MNETNDNNNNNKDVCFVNRSTPLVYICFVHKSVSGIIKSNHRLSFEMKFYLNHRLLVHLSDTDVLALSVPILSMIPASS